MTIDFTHKALDDLLWIWNRANGFGPAATFRHYYNVPADEALVTQEVEDFAMSFMTAVNRTYPGTF